MNYTSESTNPAVTVTAEELSGLVLECELSKCAVVVDVGDYVENYAFALTSKLTETRLGYKTSKDNLIKLESLDYVIFQDGFYSIVPIESREGKYLGVYAELITQKEN